MFNIIKKEVKFGGKILSIETGKIARQSTSVVVQYGDTVILCALVASKEPSSAGFFPLTVNYIEKKSSVGRIPGGFLKREGKLSDKEILTSRVVDRAIRPLFPDGFCNEVQITATLLSYDKYCDPDFLALVGTSAALAISGLPTYGVVAGCRVGLINDQFILNPSYEDMEKSDLDLTYAGTKSAVFMVESEAKELSEEKMLNALEFAKNSISPVIDMIESFSAEANPQKINFVSSVNDELYAQISAGFVDKVKEVYSIKDKQQRTQAVNSLRKEVLAKHIHPASEPLAELKSVVYGDEKQISNEMEKLESKVVRDMIFSGVRIDGRDTKTIRPINIETGILPTSCVHGSALFTRGETQALISVTLGSGMDEQYLDSIEDADRKEDFMLHYNFPAYSVNEIGALRGPGRREIGHGKLAYKAIRPLLPSKTEFPYTIRVISDITESNGSSSMATVCGTSLGLMSTGVPIKKHIAGVAMGLIKDGEKYAILTDIMGDEDHLGDMDFKVAGTRDGITALQMDIKISDISLEIMKNALAQAKDGRNFLLGKMEESLTTFGSLSESSPRIEEIKIKPEKIGDVIGKAGATIKGICEATGAKIDISEDGIVKIFAADKKSLEKATQMVKDIVTEVIIGNIYTGVVSKIMQFGAIVSLFGNHSGMVHISEISEERVNKIEDYLKEGEEVQVIAVGFDEKRRLKLSIKKAKKNTESVAKEPENQSEAIENDNTTTSDVVDYDVFVGNNDDIKNKTFTVEHSIDINELGSFGDFAKNISNKS